MIIWNIVSLSKIFADHVVLIWNNTFDSRNDIFIIEFLFELAEMAL